MDSLTSAQRAEVLKQSKLLTLRRQEPLSDFVRISAYWYLTVSGLLRVELSTRQGLATSGFIKKGDLTTELAGIPDDLQELGLRAVVDSDVMCMPLELMRATMCANSEFATEVFRGTHSRLRKLYVGVGRMNSAPADVTVGRTLFELSQPAEDGTRIVDGRITQKEIAGAVGLSREQVNKVIRQLEQRGLLVRAQEGYVVDQAFSTSKLSPLLTED